VRLLAGRGTNSYFDPVAPSKHDGWREGSIVPVRPLDDLLGGMDRLDVIKVDVEGAEGMLLDGATHVFSVLRPTLLIEFSPGAILEQSNRTGDVVVDHLIKLGYGVSQLTLAGSRVELADGAAALRAQEEQGGTHIDLLCEPRQDRDSARFP
jgi:hypothetical protein